MQINNDDLIPRILNEPVQLSDSQKEAVLSDAKHTRIIAGAGAGKTETLTRRIAYLLLVKQVPPENIVAFTFTEKAANSMKSRIYERIKSLDGGSLCLNLGDMFIGTIHGYCNRILETEFKHGNYTILDDKQEMAYVMREGFSLGIFKKGKSYSDECEKFIRSINVIYGELIPGDSIEAKDSAFYKIIKSYEDKLEKHKCLTFNLLIKRTLECFEEHPEVANKVKYLIVDEYQDIDRAQEKLIHLLGGDDNIFIVGDPRQTIYQWRGSDEQCFDDFAIYYQDTKTLQIRENNRSTPEIIEAANAFADTIEGEHYEHMLPNINKMEGGVYLTTSSTDETEAENIVHEIMHLVSSNKCHYRDIAILFRSVQTSAPTFISLFQKYRIPFVLGGRVGLFRRKEIKAIGMLFCWASENGFWREKYGKKEDDLKGDDLFTCAKQLWEESMEYSFPVDLIQEWKDGFYFSEYQNFSDAYMKLLSILGFDNLDQNDPYQASIMANMGRFNQLLTDFESPNFMGGKERKWAKDLDNLCWYIISYASSSYEEQTGDEGFSEDAVQLMTIHQSKGLEWAVVFIPAIVSQRFPSSRMGRPVKWIFDSTIVSSSVAKKYAGDLNSERKLMYVALTRGKNAVVFSNFTHTAGSERKKGESVFISDLEKISSQLENGHHIPVNEYAISGTSNELQSFAVREILDYNSCPYHYRLHHLWGFQPGMDESLGYGSSLHFCLREIGETMANKKEQPIEDLTKDVVTQHFRLPFCSKKTFASRREAARKDLEKFVSKYQSDMKNIRDVEAHIEFEHQHAILTGQIDVILHNDESKESLEVRDYKTKYDCVSEEYAEKQLYLYTYALQTHSENVVEASIAYVHNQEIHKFPIREEKQKETLDLIENSIAAIRNGVFSSNPSEEHCRYCDYRLLCKDCAVEQSIEYDLERI